MEHLYIASFRCEGMIKCDLVCCERQCQNLQSGGMAEWFKAPVLKTGVGSRPPWVRIPLPPPQVIEGLKDVNDGEVPEWLNGAAC